MGEMRLAERSPWTGLLRPGLFGVAGRDPGVVVAPADLPTALLLVARPGGDAELIRAANALGLDLPTRPAWSRGRHGVALWAGPGQWLIRSSAMPDGLARDLAGLAPDGTTIDLGHARAVLGVSGPRVRDALAKGIEIDLHPRAFRTGDAALTTAAGIPAHLWQTDDGPGYEIAVPTSYAGSFWHWLSGAAAEYGYRVDGDEAPPSAG